MKKNICVVGGGYWGKNHIRTLDALGYLGGLVDSNLSLIENYKKSSCQKNYNFDQNRTKIDENY